ncbi:hypothetical protein M8J76_001674 [Diaphorina citri]|nr:hypothetical protein M8J75_010390 [Diaphorina citri]KAI5723124.1 hypothetical protein M8J76_001674 [Diaphorina citri]
MVDFQTEVCDLRLLVVDVTLDFFRFFPRTPIFPVLHPSLPAAAYLSLLLPASSAMDCDNLTKDLDSAEPQITVRLIMQGKNSTRMHGNKTSSVASSAKLTYEAPSSIQDFL